MHSVLRHPEQGNKLHKPETGKAGKLIREHYTQYLFQSMHADIELYGIPLELVQPMNYTDNNTKQRMKYT